MAGPGRADGGRVVIAGEALIEVMQRLRGITAACNKHDDATVGLAAQQALLATEGLGDQLEALGMEDMEFEVVASNRELGTRKAPLRVTER